MWFLFEISQLWTSHQSSCSVITLKLCFHFKLAVCTKCCLSHFFRKYLLYLCNKVNCCLLFGVLLLVLHFWFKASKEHKVCSISVLIKSLSSKLCISIIKSIRHILSMKSLSISRCSVIYLLCSLLGIKYLFISWTTAL